MAVTTPNAKKNPAGVRHLSTPDILAAMMTDSDDDEPSSSKGVGGRATSVVPQSAIAPKAKGGGFCGECGASYDRAGQKFCMECGAKA